MLDILRARQMDASTNVGVLIPLISRAVDLSQDTMAGDERLEFLLALVGKFPSQRLPVKLLSKVRNAVASVTERYPQVVVDVLKADSAPSAVKSAIVSAGFADGLAHAKGVSSNQILALRNEELLRLVAYSDEFAEYLLAPNSPDSSHRMSRLIECLSHPSTDVFGRARRRIVPLLASPVHAEILRLCVRDISTTRLITVVNTIWSRTKFSVPEFDAPLRDAAKGERGQAALRETILDKPNTPEADRFLLKTIQSYPNDLMWLVDDRRVGTKRKAALLRRCVEIASDQDVLEVARDASAVHKIDSILRDELSQSAPALARVLRASAVPADFFVDRTVAILPFLDEHTRKEMTEMALTRGFGWADSSADSILCQLLLMVGEQLSPRTLVTIATPTHASSERVSSNLTILSQSPATIRRRVLLGIEELTDRLVRKHGSTLSHPAVEAWASLLRDSGSANQAGQLRAASRALSFALSHLQAPISGLVVAAYPIVDAELKTEREAPTLLTFFFTDWDRCKTARKDLIRAFLRSNWPPSDLIRAVLPTGDLAVVMQMLINERDSDRFLSELRKDIGRLPADERNHVESVLKIALADIRAPRT